MGDIPIIGEKSAETAPESDPRRMNQADLQKIIKQWPNPGGLVGVNYHPQMVMKLLQYISVLHEDIELCVSAVNNFASIRIHEENRKEALAQREGMIVYARRAMRALLDRGVITLEDAPGVSHVLNDNPVVVPNKETPEQNAPSTDNGM